MLLPLLFALQVPADCPRLESRSVGSTEREVVVEVEACEVTGPFISRAEAEERMRPAMLAQAVRERGRRLQMISISSRRVERDLVVREASVLAEAGEWLLSGRSERVFVGGDGRIELRARYTFASVVDANDGAGLHLSLEVDDRPLLTDEGNRVLTGEVRVSDGAHLYLFEFTATDSLTQLLPLCTGRGDGIRLTAGAHRLEALDPSVALTVEPDSASVWLAIAVRGPHGAPPVTLPTSHCLEHGRVRLPEAVPVERVVRWFLGATPRRADRDLTLVPVASLSPSSGRTR